MNFNERLLKYGEITEKALTGYMDKYSKNARYYDVVDAMKYSLLGGGKRIRPSVALAFCELSGADVTKALAFASALEMIHSYSLIHDDLPCMDNDDMRRGKPTSHIKYGEDIALLAGDALLTYAFEVAASSRDLGVNSERVVDGIILLSSLAGVDGMIGGQCIDLQNEGKNVTPDLIHEMDMKKTVALFSAGCQLGCIAGGADKEKQQAAASYAENMGLAFQIRDDILDVISDSETLGKLVGADAKNDKQNYITFYGLEKCNELVEEYTAKAKESLNVFDGDTGFLNDLADYLAKRDK